MLRNVIAERVGRRKYLVLQKQDEVLFSLKLKNVPYRECLKSEKNLFKAVRSLPDPLAIYKYFYLLIYIICITVHLILTSKRIRNHNSYIPKK